MKKILTLFLTLAVCFMCIAPCDTYAATAKITKTKLTLYVGDTYTLQVKNTSKTVTWKSSDSSVATISSKGKIKAIKAGTATITASVSTKKFTCKLTVKEDFSAMNALNNMNEDVTDIGDALIVIYENKYLYDFAFEATAVFYDEVGNTLGKSTAKNCYFESGTKCALYLDGPYDKNYNEVPYSNYKITYSIENISQNTKSCVKDIQIKTNYGVDNLLVNATNTGDHEPEYTMVSIVYYKAGEVIAYDCTYAEITTPGSTKDTKFSFPHDENKNTIQPDDYQVFVNYSYYSNN